MNKPTEKKDQRFELRISAAEIAAIDKARGDAPRAAWIREVISQAAENK